MFIELHFVGIISNSNASWTREPQQQGFINKYKVFYFVVNKKPPSFLGG
jgi:hypothetical protein